MKADLLRARNMKRYINQLTVAKKQCEKRIRTLGGPAYDQQEDGALDEGEGPQSQKVELFSSCFDHFLFVMNTDGIRYAVLQLFVCNLRYVFQNIDSRVCFYYLVSLTSGNEDGHGR